MLLASGWRIGVGDPTVIGWTITVGYFAAALASIFRGFSRVPDDPRERNPWLIVATISAALGINKQLDFQTLFLEFGRTVALSEHWYPERRFVQFAFVLGLSAAALALAWKLVHHYRGFVLRHPEVSIGVGLVVAYSLLRASEIDHLDFGGTVDAFSSRWLWVVELAGVSLIFFGALLRPPTRASV